jgi:hypothetical protein
VSQRSTHSERVRRRAACALIALLAAASASFAGDKASATSRCRYSDEGKLVFSPRGVSCPAYAAPPAEIDLAAELAPQAPPLAAPAVATPVPATPAKRAEQPAPVAVAPARAASVPAKASLAEAKPAPAPALAAKPTPASELAVISRAELAALLAERDGLAEELTRIRDALDYQDREAARRVADASLARIAEHLDAEERLLLKLGAARDR